MYWELSETRSTPTRDTQDLKLYNAHPGLTPRVNQVIQNKVLGCKS